VVAHRARGSIAPSRHRWSLEPSFEVGQDLPMAFHYRVWPITLRHQRRWQALVALGALLGMLPALVSVAAAARPLRQRFSVMGPGHIAIKSAKNDQTFRGRYRDRHGHYRVRALRQINRVFGVPDDETVNRISLRLIERLAYLRSHTHGNWIIISSGYRSPAYNRALRDKGATVALASLHQYGMAADLRIEGVGTKRAWKLARRRRLGGAGYYNSPWMHLDVGPTRFWTQSTANVRKGRSLQNKTLILVPRYDIYRAAEPMRLRFARMTAFPIGVRPTMVLQQQRGEHWVNIGSNRVRLGAGTTKDPCRELESVAEMADIKWKIPEQIEPGRYRLQATFCRRRWPEMPQTIVSYPFTIVR